MIPLRLLFLFLVLPASLDAQDLYQPKLVNNKDQSSHDFPMGVLEATGRLCEGERSILLMDLAAGGVGARGGLRVGDRLESFRGRRPGPFSMKTDAALAGPQAALAEALERACAKAPHRLVVSVRRGEESLDVAIPVPPAAAFASSFPKRCAKRRAYLTGIVERLVATQLENGRWRPGVGGDADVYMSAFCALTVLAGGRVEHRATVERAIAFIKQKSIASIEPGDPKAGPKSWQAASSALLLAEYHLATGDASVLADLKLCCDLLSARVSPDGTMGHRFVVGYDGGGLVVINAQAHLAWALAEKCGLKVDLEAWGRSMVEIERSIDPRTGGLGYSGRARRSPDISARTGAMAAALAISGRRPKLARRLTGSLIAHPGRMRHAHAMSSIGLIFGVAGVRLVDPKAYGPVVRAWRPYLELCRNGRGSAFYFGGKRNFGGDMYLGLEPVGNAMVGLTLASADGRLFLHGGRRRAWLGATRER